MLTSTQSLLDFRRHELLTRASTSRGCMAVFPQGKKARQRVAVGDCTGSVLVFTVGKHNDVQAQFETPAGPKAVNRVTLFDDQLFYIAGSQVAAYSKKGKAFFGFDTNVTEAVRSFQIDTPFIFAGGEYVLSTFKEVAEAGYFMAPDRINEMLIHKHRDANNETPAIGNYHVYLACNDRVLRTVMNNAVIAEAGCEAPITSLAYAIDSRGTDLLYGTNAGSLGAFTITKTDELARKFSLIPEARLGTITSLASTDINLDGTSDVILGREDGSVEVHVMSLHADNAAPLRMWTGNVGEYVTSLATGMITQTERDEVLVNTFSGKVIAFSLSDDDMDVHKLLPAVMTAKPLDVPSAQEVIVKTRKADEKKAKNAEQAQQLESPVKASPTSSATPLVAQVSAEVEKPAKKASEVAAISAAAAPPPEKAEKLPSSLEIAHAQVNEIRSEIQRLKSSVEAKRSEFAALAGMSESSKVKAVTSEFKVRDSFSLDGAAALVLTIESDVPLEYVGIQCDVPLEMIDGEGVVSPCSYAIHRDAKATKVLSVLKPSEERPNRVQATFRTQEGCSGAIQAYIVAKPQPRTAQMRSYAIRPLSLHHRITESEVDWNALPLSSLTMQGTFSIRDMHGWLLGALPEVPEVLPSAATSNALYFRNTFQSTVLSVRYGKGEAEFLSDSLTALTILKDALTKEATGRKIQVRIQSNVRKESVLRHLQLLHPLIGYQASLHAKMKLVEALREIETQEQDNAFLSAEYKQIIAKSREIEEEVKLQPMRMEYLKSILLQLCRDKASFLGENMSNARIQQLSELISTQYNDKAIEQFFGVDKLAPVAQAGGPGHNQDSSPLQNQLPPQQDPSMPQQDSAMVAQ